MRARQIQVPVIPAQQAQRKMWTGTTTTNVSGVWTVDYSSAGFTSNPTIQATVLGAGLTAGDTRNASTSSISTTTASGIATRAATISILGALSLTLVGAGVVVHVTAMEVG